ncbi:hypothetical protein KBA27_06705 [bacterium]|nr:hypothetical protein [bacterium]
MNFLLNSESLLDHVTRKADSNIPETVQELIQSVIRSKASNYEFEFYKENIYLPLTLQKTNLEQRILSTNLELIRLSKEYNFSRLQETDYSTGNNDGVNENDLDENDRYNLASIFLDCLTKDEFEEYSRCEFSDKDLITIKNWYRRGFGRKIEITLPRFELITDYFGLINFFDSLIQDFDSDYKVKNPATKYRFKTNLTESKIQNLFEVLIDKECISPQTSQDEFLWIFGVDNSKVDIGYIEWLKSKSMAVYFIDMLYAFNFLTNFDKMWAIGSRVFGIKNMAQIKQNYISTNSSGKPKGYAIIDEIISSL